ncbi:MAG: nuclear transport factor 2 family protein [Burkholderiales bacterium]|nr:nuclear transport factor 2 family protein [Burkholderiales bacterium]
MSLKLRTALVSIALCIPMAAWAQVPVEATKDQAKLLLSADPQLAANKRLVYDFWREILEGGHVELADKYLAESYIQHNPAVGTGRAAFVELFSKLLKPKPIAATIQGPLVTIVAEGDRVIMSFVQEVPDPKHPGKTYTTTWFDMFRVENGKLAEHWDPAQL